jgi:hypothetical protein
MFRKTGHAQRIADLLLVELLVKAEIFPVTIVTVMTVMVYNHHNLRLRRIRYCETEDEHEAEQNLFHI